MKERIILLISLAILILSPMIAQACDTAGEGDTKWTVYAENKTVFIIGNICGENGWQRAIDINGEKVYFGASFLIIKGHISEPKDVVKSEPKEDKQRISW